MQDHSDHPRVAIADSSPVIVLLELNHTDILPTMFGKVVVPPQVVAELSNGPPLVREFGAKPPEWLVVRSPVKFEHIRGLHPGETAAIALAMESSDSLLIIDEQRGRAAAERRGVRITGTIGLLGRAARLGLLDLGQTFERLRATSFWVSDSLLESELEQFRKERGS